MVCISNLSNGLTYGSHYIVYSYSICMSSPLNMTKSVYTFPQYLTHTLKILMPVSAQLELFMICLLVGNWVNRFYVFCVIIRPTYPNFWWQFKFSSQ